MLRTFPFVILEQLGGQLATLACVALETAGWHSSRIGAGGLAECTRYGGMTRWRPCAGCVGLVGFPLGVTAGGHRSRMGAGELAECFAGW